MKSYRVRERSNENLLEDLLSARGVSSGADAEQFLAPDFLRDSHDPFKLPDMEKAVERLHSALKNNEHIAVWSDYDCDGIPGGVMLTEFLRAVGGSVTHYIPHRHKEGYGLNIEGIEELAGQKVSVIITVDLGTSDVEPIAFARKKEIDVIVTDHHVVSNGAAKPFALINPKRKDSTYPFDGLCGAGVAWKLVQGMLIKNRLSFPEGQEKWFLDLVGIATLSDRVPLTNENRMLAHFGLRVIRRGRRPGLSALLQMLRIKRETLTEDDIGFMVAPRINAASRMDTPQTAARLLATFDFAEAKELARALNKVNDERKGIVAATVKEVNKRLLASERVESPIIVMGNPNWRPGILGLVASSLVDTQGKTVFLWGREGGDVIRGSCRSHGGVSVVSLMQDAGDIFDHFGGHHASGGFSLSQERVHELPQRLALAYKKVAMQGEVAEEILIDRELDIEEIPQAMRTLARLAPFGEGNAKPLFLFSAVSIGSTRTFGKNNDHLEVQFARGETHIAGMAFFSGVDSFTKKIIEREKAGIIGHAELDWKGQPRIRIVDVI